MERSHEAWAQDVANGIETSTRRDGEGDVVEMALKPTPFRIRPSVTASPCDFLERETRGREDHTPHIVKDLSHNTWILSPLPCCVVVHFAQKPAIMASPAASLSPPSRSPRRPSLNQSMSTPGKIMNGHFASVGEAGSKEQYENGIQVIDEDKNFK